MKSTLILFLLAIQSLFSQIDTDTTFVNNTTLSDETLAKILAKNGCYLATKPNGLDLIRENILAHDKNGKPLKYSGLANSFALFLQDDQGLKHQGKLIDIEKDAIVFKNTNILFAQVCWPKEKHKKFEKQIYPKIPSRLRYNLTSILTKVYAKELTNNKNSGPHTVEGNIYLNLFKKNMYQLGDYLIDKIENQLGKRNTLTIEDITTSESRNFLKEHFCHELAVGNKKDEADIRRYLKKFYGSDKCTKN